MGLQATISQTEYDMPRVTHVKRTSPQRTRRTSTKRWSATVTQHSAALDLEPGVFKREPKALAQSLKCSAERSSRRKSSPYRSAMSMLTFYINRAGKRLSSRERATLERAKIELRKLFGVT